MHGLVCLLLRQRGEELSLDLLRNGWGKLQIPEPSNLRLSTREEHRDLVLAAQALLAERSQDSLLCR